ncbi:MAG: prepilin-type N-terminal cleavage/methylation domain-containing protein, partial [Nitrospirales bacterium]|nr:prepilin-type N-terminal cleavage/methylation domain-containing protein [Nitrospirales bacterium]
MSCKFSTLSFGGRGPEPAHERRTSWRREGGFTLLELIIVLFLITLILGLSTVFFTTSLSSGRLNSTAREMAAALRHARVMANMRGDSMLFTIDL